MARSAPFSLFAEGIGVALTPAQRVLCSVAFDGANPCDFDGEDRELAARLFGDVDVVPPLARSVVVAVCGARAGKSYVLCGLRLLHLALTVPLASLAPGEVAAALIVAPDMRLAKQTLRYALGAAKTVGAIALEGENEESFTLRRDGHLVTVQCLPATRGGSALRGRSLVGAVLDEAAFFRDESSAVNDVEVFKAVAPRVMPGGQVIVASTPWLASGLLYDLFQRNHGHPVTALAAHAPTTLLRGDARTRGMVERERDRDADNARREFDAEFLESGAEQFFPPALLNQCVDPLAGASGAAYAGVDLGFERNSSALVIVRRPASGVAGVAHVLEKKPSKAAGLVPSEVCAEFADVMKRFGVTRVYGDIHYQATARELFSKAGIGYVVSPAGAKGKEETHREVRTALAEGKLRLCDNARLVKQLGAVIARPTPGGGVAISSPRGSDGSHGDVASAFVLAGWAARRRREIVYDASLDQHLPRVFNGFGGGGDDDDDGWHRPRRRNEWP